MNREWHKQHKMPGTTTENERIEWHIEHTRNCSCRGFPEGLLPKLSEKQRAQIGQRGIENGKPPLR
jgi:hypothetical protein